MVASGTPCAAALSIVALVKCPNTLVMKIKANNARPIGTMARMTTSTNSGATHVPACQDLVVNAAGWTLEDVIAWAHPQRPPCEIVEGIVQDEFTHDVIVRGP